MKSALATTTALEKIALRARGVDPRESALLSGAADLGITSVVRIEVSDLVFLQASLDDASRATMHDLLVEKLLQHGEWCAFDESVSAIRDRHVVESALLPGVTDRLRARSRGSPRARELMSAESRPGGGSWCTGRFPTTSSSGSRRDCSRTRSSSDGPSTSPSSLIRADDRGDVGRSGATCIRRCCDA